MAMFEILVLFLAVPVGYLIAYFANDELVDGRKWFKILIALALITGGWAYYAGLRFITLTCVFIIIVAAISLIKSRDKKWTKRKL